MISYREVMDAAVEMKVDAVVSLYADPSGSGVEAMLERINASFDALLDKIVELGRAHDAQMYPEGWPKKRWVLVDND